MFISRLNIFNVILLILAVAAVSAVAADQPAGPQQAPKAVPSAGKESATKPAPPAKPQQATPAGGVVVFIDPATGQIRQPDPSEIGGLVTPTTSPAPKAPEPTLIQGPGGAIGARLGPETMTYMVVSTTPEGKLETDCVTGEKAAMARVATPAVKAQGPSTEGAKQHPQDTHPSQIQKNSNPQETQNAKIPR